ncbi:hypothetical protein HMPREF9123_0303 [Neisseria bacilliformis ATCC BAA-1200]|uniref:Uncharacterized protein n=1 Tax=Neisseria bacilliformis ATCC BAA-1200 TaxID=888742 RepID=F2B9A0_9NEIS|nr:hypothetical protein HMPREF9123_0303 [Neisseria bacilliformis ATCC BAA-1200]
MQLRRSQNHFRFFRRPSYLSSPTALSQSIKNAPVPTRKTD